MTEPDLPVPDSGASRSGPPAQYEIDPPGYHPGWDGHEEETTDWRQYVGAVLRNKWLVALGLVAGIAVGFLLKQDQVPTYQVEATVWIETEGRGASGDAAPIRPSQLLGSAGWVDLMTSFTVLDPVVEDLKLFIQPHGPGHAELFEGFDIDEGVRYGSYLLRVERDGSEVVLLTADEQELERARPGSALGADIGFRWTPAVEALTPGMEAGFSVRRTRDAAWRLSRDLNVRIDRAGTFLRVGLEGTDPERITRTVNHLVERYTQVAEELKRARLDELTSILEEQLAYAEDNLRNAELALESFKVRTISLPSEQGSPGAPGIQQTQDPVFRNFFNLRLAQEEARRDRQAIQRAMERSREEGRLVIEALEVIPSVRESSELRSALALSSEKRAELRALGLRYTDEHPAVRELRRDLDELERQTVPALVDHLLVELESRQQEADRFVDQTARQLQEIPSRAVEETRLERRFQSAENLFRDLQGRYESARLGAASTVPDVRVLDLAQVPQTPSRADPRGRFFALAVLAGLGLGVVGALVRDRLDPRVRTPEQVTRGLGLPILAALPHARHRNGGMREEDQQQLVEAFRNLRLAVSYAHGPRGPVSLAISSPGVGEGKSFTTANLGLAFAEAGYRVAIIDGDVRRGTMHTFFACDRKPGLVDHLAGEAGRDEVVRSIDHPLLKLIPCGSRFRDGPELLSRPEMGSLMDDLRSRFDVILVDTPPMGAAVDPYLLGTLAGSMLLIVRDGNTDLSLAEARLTELARLPIRVLGVALNAVPSGAGPYRYYSYLPGYDARDEDSRGRKLVVR
jgi:polysaccharide biosynthesis transport protein